MCACSLLQLCHFRYVLYKYVCNRGLITTTKKVEDVFISKGFNNWKKARERFGHH